MKISKDFKENSKGAVGVRSTCSSDQKKKRVGA